MMTMGVAEARAAGREPSRAIRQSEWRVGRKER
jgi:hypothetical protein